MPKNGVRRYQGLLLVGIESNFVDSSGNMIVN
jgi:hypothetical protein